MMAVVALGYGEEILRKVLKNISLAEECAKTRKQIQEGIEAFGMVVIRAAGRCTPTRQTDWAIII